MTLQSGWVAPGIFLLTVKTINRKHKRSLWVAGRWPRLLRLQRRQGALRHTRSSVVWGRCSPRGRAWPGPASGGRQACALPTRGGHGGAPPHCPPPSACHAPWGGFCTTGGAGAPRRVTSGPQALADLGSAARTLTATAPEEQSPQCAQDLSPVSHKAAGLGERGRHTASVARREPTSHMHSPDGTDQSSLARTPKHSRSLWLSDASQNETQHGH